MRHGYESASGFSHKQGCPGRGPKNKGYSILGSTSGSRHLGKLPYMSSAVYWALEMGGFFSICCTLPESGLPPGDGIA